MSKYDELWKYIGSFTEERFVLSFDEIEEHGGIPIDHSFLKYKKELIEYGYAVNKISMKNRTVEFKRETERASFK